jgi:hypothetical protein
MEDDQIIDSQKKQDKDEPDRIPLKQGIEGVE